MTDDFGRRLEAELDRYDRETKSAPVDPLLALLFIVRAANAQDSASARGEWTDGGKVFEEAPGVVSTNPARSLLRELAGNPTHPLSASCALLLSHIEALERDAARWRYFRDEMDDSDKLHMLAHGTVHYDSDIDAARKEAK